MVIFSKVVKCFLRYVNADCDDPILVQSYITFGSSFKHLVQSNEWRKERKEEPESFIRLNSDLKNLKFWVYKSNQTKNDKSKK